MNILINMNSQALYPGMTGQYGLHAGVPCLIGNDGVEKVVEIKPDSSIA